MIYLVFFLFFLLIFFVYFCIKFALIILNIQETIEDSLDIIDEKYNKISKILEIPVFYNSPEVKSAISEIEDAREALLYIANQLTSNKNKEEEDYFDLNVQNKIIEYQNSKCVKEKNNLYEHHIFPAFEDLVQSLVSVYGFKSTNEDINHLKSDCVTFLFETLHKWSPDKGTKAFSYFNVVAKNWLTIQSRRLLKIQRRSAYIDDPDSLNSKEKSELFDREYIDSDVMMSQKEETFNKILQMINYV